MPKTLPAMVAMTLLVVTEPKPPTEWPAHREAAARPEVGVLGALQGQGMVDADAEEIGAVVDHVVERGDDVAGPDVAAAQARPSRRRSAECARSGPGRSGPFIASQNAALISRVRWLPVVESGSSMRSKTVNARQFLSACDDLPAGERPEDEHRQAPGGDPLPRAGSRPSPWPSPCSSPCRPGCTRRPRSDRARGSRSAGRSCGRTRRRRSPAAGSTRS